MDTRSLLVSLHVHARMHAVLLLVLAVALCLGVAALVGLVLDPLVHQPAADPLLGPFRWVPGHRNLA